MNIEKNSKHQRGTVQNDYNHDKAKIHFQKQFKDRLIFKQTQINHFFPSQSKKSLKRHAFPQYARKSTIKLASPRLSTKNQVCNIFNSDQNITFFFTQQNTKREKLQADISKSKSTANFKHLKKILNAEHFVSKRFRPSINTRLPGHVMRQEDAILQSQIQLSSLQISKNCLGISQKIYSQFVFNKLKVPLEKPKYTSLNKKRLRKQQNFSFDQISTSLEKINNKHLL